MRVSQTFIPINRPKGIAINDEVRRTLFLGAFLGTAGAATLAIWSSDPLVEWTYELGMFVLAGAVVLRENLSFRPTLAIVTVLALWGFGQLATGATIYRYATLSASLRVAGLGATMLVASALFRRQDAREQFLRWFSWFAFSLSLTAVVAYYTSPGRVLWLFPSRYPDIWGPFLSRNNFAQFLELAFPVCLWLACTRLNTLYLGMSASMLASGFVSASRAGAILLIVEAIIVFMLVSRRASRRLIPWFALSAISLAAVAGGEVLVRRMHDFDPFRERREIYGSALSMITERPWSGFGLGNFPIVYPQFASFDPGATVEHAHNDWLEWSAEGGLPYSALWLLLAITAFRPALRSVWGIGVPAVFLHALVDYPFARFGVAAWVFILAGALEKQEGSQ